MVFDYTNYLEVDGDVEADFVFTDRAGNLDSGLQVRNTAGQWCLETNGATTSSGTGPTANPPGRIAYVYTEASTPAASTVWAMRRNISRDNTDQNVFLDIIYNLNIDVGSEFYVEYATVASPNETTDWTILETITGTATDEWITDTFDFSGVAATSTLWIRIRFNSLNAYTNDLAFSTWREYTVTVYELSGVTYDKNGDVLGSCECYLFKDNLDNTLTFVDYALSNASTGAYTFTIFDGDAQYLVVAWKDDTPHIFDVTDHVLQGTEV